METIKSVVALVLSIMCDRNPKKFSNHFSNMFLQRKTELSLQSVSYQETKIMQEYPTLSFSWKEFLKEMLFHPIKWELVGKIQENISTSTSNNAVLFPSIIIICSTGKAQCVNIHSSSLSQIPKKMIYGPFYKNISMSPLLSLYLKATLVTIPKCHSSIHSNNIKLQDRVIFNKRLWNLCMCAYPFRKKLQAIVHHLD